jgi:hypothetical protein
MVSFQQDFLLTIYKNHKIYKEKINNLFQSESLTQNLSVLESEKLIEHLKIYKKQMNDINNTIDNMLNIKRDISLEEKIEAELMIKILPIMSVYRTLLNEKYTSNYENVNNRNLTDTNRENEGNQENERNEENNIYDQD